MSEFHWSLFIRYELTIFDHWFRQWLCADQATSHYLKLWWLVYRRIYASLDVNGLKTTYAMWWIMLTSLIWPIYVYLGDFNANVFIDVFLVHANLCKHLCFTVMWLKDTRTTLPFRWSTYSIFCIAILQEFWSLNHQVLLGLFISYAKREYAWPVVQETCMIILKLRPSAMHQSNSPLAQVP